MNVLYFRAPCGTCTHGAEDRLKLNNTLKRGLSVIEIENKRQLSFKSRLNQWSLSSQLDRDHRDVIKNSRSDSQSNPNPNPNPSPNSKSKHTSAESVCTIKYPLDSRTFTSHVDESTMKGYVLFIINDY